ncbi:hypothetical protein [Fusobacterium nucleatum]|uniref:hypothetical protein n=1 Tax=Fusobacterium nucleatum TaxID=851 RepID=UPI00355C7D49
MKKILLNLLLLFFLISCGGIKKDPEVVKYIIDKVNTDIEMVIPRGEIDTSSSNALMLREMQLAKNIKVEVTDVLSNKEYIELYTKKLEELEAKSPGSYSPLSPEEIKERSKDPNIVYYKYVITADIVNLDEDLKRLHPKMKNFNTILGTKAELFTILSDENISNLKYETVEGFGYFRYNTETKQGDYTNTVFGISKNFQGYLEIGPFLEARGHEKYNFNTPLEE